MAGAGRRRGGGWGRAARAPRPPPGGRLAAGGHHSAAAAAGRLLVWGRGEHGQLGLGPADALRDAERPREVGHLRRVSWVSCGSAHTLAVAEGGKLFSWGHARSFLGHGDHRTQREHVKHVAQPREVAALSAEGPVARAAAGWAHSVCLLRGTPGRVFAWGCGGRGRLGLGDEEDAPLPREVRAFPQAEGTAGAPPEGVVEVAAGAEHSAALGAAGAVWTWGSGASCGLGLPSREEAVTAPRRVERGLPPGFRAGALALGAFHGALLGAGPGALAGAVFTFGRGESGQLGHGLAQDEPRPRRVRDLEDLPARAVGAGAFHTLVGLASGELVAFGSTGAPPGLEGAEGRLGCDPTEAPAPSGRGGGDPGGGGGVGGGAAPAPPARYLAKPRLVLGPWQAREGSEVVAVAGGGYHSAFATRAGEVFTMGARAGGRLGRPWRRDDGGTSCAEPRRVALPARFGSPDPAS